MSLDPLAEAMAMLDETANDFIDFAIDSDDDDDVVDVDVDVELDMNVNKLEIDEMAATAVEGKKKKELEEKELEKEGMVNVNKDMIADDNNVSIPVAGTSSGEDRVSSVGVGGISSDSYVEAVDKSEFAHPLEDVGGNGAEAGRNVVESGGASSWSSFSSNFATFASRAAASMQSAVESASPSMAMNPAQQQPQQPQQQPKQQLQQHSQSSPAPSLQSSTSSISEANNNQANNQANQASNQANQVSLENELDAAVKSELISSALGPLLPGERVIMFLNGLKDVKESSSPQSFVASSISSSNGTPLLWCCVMTFYRVAIFSYSIQNNSIQSNSIQNNSIQGNSSFQGNSIPWIEEQSVSLPFQVSQQCPPKHFVIQMPLASIERVEKIGSSSSVMAAAAATPNATMANAASSAMSSFGSQMKPLLAGYGASYTTAASSASLPPPSLSPLGIVLHGKDNGRWIHFSTHSLGDAMRAQEALHTYAFPGRRNLGYLFAFESRRAEVMASSQQDATHSHNIKAATPPTRRRFEPMQEFQRQNLFAPRPDGTPSPWAPMHNSNYSLCSTYPQLLVGPRSIIADNPAVLRRCAAFRSENRLPALTWGTSQHNGTIWRASQPKVGLQGNRSLDDERYLNAIATSSSSSSSSSSHIPYHDIAFLKMLCGNNYEADLILPQRITTSTTPSTTASTIHSSSSCLLKIMDMRPRSAAMANRTQGYGYENTNYYRGTTINFYGIGNIHAVRDAYQKLSSLCLSPTTPDVQWNQLVESTNWPSMIRLILSASWQTAFHVHYNHLPVLLHCSHGWDRTSQVSALSQLLLDPYYRTKDGFSCLIEKDFMAFGHPFHTRCAHGEGKNEGGGDEGQLSPIFLQFLDCVYQLLHQFPTYFEFNTRYLLLLSEHIYSCRFGTLLCDSEKEREVVAGIRQRTYCLWEYLDSIPQLINPTYQPSNGVLLMPLPMLLRNVTLWTDRFCMYGPKATLPCLPPARFGPNSIPPMIQSGTEHPMWILTCQDQQGALLKQALEDVEMWKSTAMKALNELKEFKKDNDDGDDKFTK